MTKIAIIGAGLSGLTLAARLSDSATITLYEKARGVGGRMATRRAAPFAFDHGAQFFTIKDDRFYDFLKPLIDAGIVQRWDGRFFEFEGNQVAHQRQWDAEYPHYVGAPSMSAIGKALAEPYDIQLNQKVHIQKHDDLWQVLNEDAELLGEYDWVICTAPTAQCQMLVPEDCSFYPDLAQTTMLPCFSLMLGFQEPIALSFDCALVREADISWISVNSSKPGRGEAQSILIHSTNLWAQSHIDEDKDKVMDYLIAQSERVTGLSLQSVTHKGLHAWRYANIDKQVTRAPFIDHEEKIAACGDWCLHGRVEAAFLAANNLAKQLKQYF